MNRHLSLRHAQLPIFMKTSRILAHTIAALLLAPSLHAVELFWADPGGGLYADLLNWDLTNGGPGGDGIPGAADGANFTLNNTFTVTFNAATTTNLTLDVEDGNVTFSLNGNTLVVTSSAAIDIGNVPAQTGRLTVRNGILGTDTNGDDVTIGTTVGSTGFLTIAGGGRLGDGTIRPDLNVGTAGAGTVTVTDNGRADVQSLRVATNVGTSGTLVINGAAALLNVNGVADIGLASTAR